MARNRSRIKDLVSASTPVALPGTSSSRRHGARGPGHTRGAGRADGCAGDRTALLAEARGSLIAAGVVLLVVTALVGGFLFWLAPAPAEAVPGEVPGVHLYGDAKTQVDSLTVQAGYVQAEIDSLDTQLESYTESFNQMQMELSTVNTQMASLRRELRAAEADHTYRVRKMNERLCALYKSGGRDELLSVLFESDGIDDLISRMRVIATLADQDRHLVDGLNDSTDKLNILLAQIDKSKRQELDIRKQIDSQRNQIQVTLANRESALAGIDTEIARIIEEERKRQAAEQERLRQALLALINGGQIYDGPLPETDSEILTQFLQTAAFYIGIPYVWAGDRPSTGFDCSGFTAFVYRQHGVSLPHYSGYQAQMGYPVSPDQIKAGDLVAFGFPVHHVGIYIGDGLFIHAPRTGDVVKISPLSERIDLAAIRRFDLQPRIGEPALW